MPQAFPQLINPPPAVLAVWQRLHAAGFCAHFVGGCVRDALLDGAPHDWDICTAATPDEVRACFSGARVLDTGLAHGTVTVLADSVPAAMEASGETPVPIPIEITTYRIETGYADHRRPDNVLFTQSLADDLARRDFTVNAMAYSPADGLVDLHGGQTDLAARVLRCVGAPARRFDEDALRILRALRFAATLGFSLAPETAQAACAARDLLRFVSRERVYAELTKLLCGTCAGEVLRGYPDMIFAVLPQLAPMYGLAQNSPYHDKDVWLHTAAAVEAAPLDAVTRWALLLHDSGKPQCHTQDEAGRGHFYGHPAASAALAQEILTRLHADAATRESVQRLVRWHDVPLEATAVCAARWLRRLGEADLRRLLAVKRADTAAHAPGVAMQRARQTEQFEQFLNSALAKGRCLRLRELAVNGADVLACGVAQGPAVGEVLRFLLDSVLAQRLPNERNALLAAARQLAASRAVVCSAQQSAVKDTHPKTE